VLTRCEFVRQSRVPKGGRKGFTLVEREKGDIPSEARALALARSFLLFEDFLELIYMG
jgi:hypothetical protein